eukprot:3089996-Rhodomonas_salina.2
MFQACESHRPTAGDQRVRIQISLQDKLHQQLKKLKEGKHYEDAFVPVPRTTATRVSDALVTALAAGNDMHLHSMDISQAFIQA